jgi:hypothetical protein
VPDTAPHLTCQSPVQQGKSKAPGPPASDPGKPRSPSGSGDRHHQRIVLALLLLLQSSSPATTVEGRGSPTAEIPRVEAAVRIDGVLDEPVWAEATRLTGFWQYQPVDGRPAEERTDVLAWYAPDAIHFGIIAFDRVPSAIRATVADRDNIDREDQVVLNLDTFHDRRRAFFFGVNPLGCRPTGCGARAPARS